MPLASLPSDVPLVVVVPLVDGEGLLVVEEKVGVVGVGVAWVGVE